METAFVNFVPHDRRASRRRGRRLQTWITVCSIYALLGGAAYPVLKMAHGRDDRALGRQLEETQARVEHAEATEATLRLDVRRTGAQLQANIAVGRQPDWSVLLALLSTALGDEVVLRRIRLDATSGDSPAGPGPGVAGEGTDEPKVTIGLDLTGLGRSQGSVSRFVLLLEQSPPFEQVTLIDTRREPFLADHAISFNVTCGLGGDEEVSP
ncbi:MAG: PilN domain-containing protein [Planctomycetota bacterium]|jgi:Tfp pilus assembly protein PilN